MNFRRKTFFYLLLAIVCVFASVLGYFAYLDRNAFDSLPRADFEDDSKITVGHVPKICTGLEHTSSHDNCPQDFAIYSTQDSSSAYFRNSAGSVPLDGVCCPLPAEDILTDEHAYNVKGACPDNYIVTGRSAHGCGDNCFVRCTRINTKRYRLGKKLQAVYWKRPDKYPSGGRGGARQISLLNVPWAIRYAAAYSFIFAERGVDGWDQDGCVGVPPGSVLVEKQKDGCGGIYFRPILFKDGGRMVRTYPECSSISGAEQKDPKCVQGRE